MLRSLLPPLAVILAVTASFSAAAAEPSGGNRFGNTPPGSARVYKTSAGKPRTLELYFPPGHDPKGPSVPGVLLFHGGGWSGGTLQQFRRACDYFASRGLVCATAEYRMLSKEEAARLPAGETKKRVCVTDAKSALRWFKQHAAELGVDPRRIVTGGGSAGGHISALATLNPGLNDPADPAGIDTSVVAYLWFNPAFAPDDQQDPEIDVLRFLRRDQAPSIAFFGTKDTWKAGWDAAHAKLAALGHTGVSLHLAPDQAHSFFNQDPWQTLTLIEADRFLARLGLLRGEPTLKVPAGAARLVAGPTPSPAR
jgi:acetyl esterase